MPESAHCSVIAEAGVNHNGSLDMALRLIDIAAEAGADIVKFQTFKSDLRMTLLAPTDEAFSRLSEDVLEQLLIPENKPLLLELLLVFWWCFLLSLWTNSNWMMLLVRYRFT